jgi:cytochrome c-type biogenesis protein CcmH/NrfG
VAPDDPEPHWYLGLAAAQSGAKDQAAQHWRQLLELLEADHPERNFFETRLAELEAATSAPVRSGD